MALRQFIKRNILEYFRNRSSVFFSLLSTIIVLLVMISFLANTAVDSTLMVMGEGSNQAQNIASRFTAIWTISGILVVNAVSISMTLIGKMVQDREYGRLNAFFVAPVSRIVYIVGYIISSIIVTLIMCLLIFVIGQIYIYSIGGEIISFINFIKFLIILLAIIFSSSAFVFLFATFIKNSSAYSGFITVMGTLIGFFAAVYIPYGAMHLLLKRLLKIMPTYHGSSALRQLLSANELKSFNISSGEMNEFSEYMGIVIKSGDYTLSMNEKVLFMSAVGLVLIIISSIILRSKRKSENIHI